MLKRLLAFGFVSLMSMAVSAENLPADPTKPATSFAVSDVEKGAEQFTVSSLITGKKRNLAVVNGQSVYVGDLVDGAKVLKIGRQGVHLEVLGERQFISLTDRQGFSKKKSVK
ncbi:MAG: hypothetical protein JXR18_16075 [Neptuniibacter sp.]